MDLQRQNQESSLQKPSQISTSLLINIVSNAALDSRGQFIEEKLKSVFTDVRIFSAGLTIGAAIDTGTQITTLKNTDKKLLYRTLVILVRDFLTAFKRKRGIETKEELFALVVTIENEFKFLKVEEIAYAFKLARVGRLGNVLDTVDEFTVISFLRAYEKSEEKIAYHENANKKAKNKNNPKPTRGDFQTDEDFEKAIEGYKKAVKNGIIIPDANDKEMQKIYHDGIKAFYEEGLKYQQEAEQREKARKNAMRNHDKAKSQVYINATLNKKKAMNYCFSMLTEDEQFIVEMAMRAGTNNFSKEELSIYKEFMNNVTMSLHGEPFIE